MYLYLYFIRNKFRKNIVSPYFENICDFGQGEKKVRFGCGRFS